MELCQGWCHQRMPADVIASLRQLCHNRVVP